MTTTFTHEQLAALDAAIAEGVRKVKYQDKEVEYRTLDEMLQLRDLIKRELGLCSGGARRVGVFGSGL